VTENQEALQAIIAGTPDATFDQAGGFGYTDEIAVGLDAYWKEHPSGSLVAVGRMDLCWLLEGYARARLENPLIDLLREALPIVKSDAREWFEGASAASNRRRMAAAAVLASRIEDAIWRAAQ
jgi:hypothetical protein